MSGSIPSPVVKRLPMYYRYLLAEEQKGSEYISSNHLGMLTGLTASQVRQDMNCFGGTGTQGRGYRVAEMRAYIGSLLGIHRMHSMIIIGMGNLGCAIANGIFFDHTTFSVEGAFDVDPHKTGCRVGPVVVQPLHQLQAFVTETPVDIAVLTLPAQAAQETAQRLYQLGIRGFWNFAPVDLQLPQDASVVNVHLDESLELLSYRLHNPSPW